MHDATDLLARSNLSTSQFLLWLGQRLHPESPLYNMVLAFDIEGPLDARRFVCAFDAVAKRCDALRTVIEEADGVPLQRVRDAGPAVERVDLEAAAEPEVDLQAWLAGRAARAFDLRARLVDTALIRLGPERHVWYLNQHHLVTDAYATSLVYRHVAAAYAHGEAEGPAPPPYEGFVEHERRLRGTALHARVRAWWARLLESPPAPVRLYGRDGAGAGTRTERLTVDLGEERSARVRMRAAELGAGALSGDAARFELFATTLIAYLHRVSGQERLAIGTPAHNRPTALLKETIGPLIELFPLVLETGPEETFRTLQAKVRAQALGLLRHAQPGASSPALLRGLNVVLNYIHATFPPFAGLPMRSEWIHSGHGDSRHHLRLQVHDFDAAGRFVLHFDLNRTLFDGPTRRAAAGHFVRMLDALLDAPDRAPATVDLQGDAGGRVVVPAAASETVIAMVQAQAARTPDAVAVSFGDRDVTYAELLGRAEALARRLCAAGAGPETRVGICLERSPEAVIAVLGVLLAGAAYVPLAPDDPAERTSFVRGDAGIRLLVTRPGLETRLDTTDAQVLYVDAGQADANAPGRPPAPGAAAYVLYTSGSTGRPKGVVVEQGSLALYIEWARAEYARGRPLDMPLFTSLSFDLTVTSLFLPLVTGGRVVVQPDEGTGGAALLSVLDEDRVDAIKLTPSHLALMEGTHRQASRVRLLIVGGEDLKTALARDAVRAFGGSVALINEYGPTEATVACTFHRFDPGCDGGRSVPIGRPAGAARIHIVDGGLNPVPPGVEGEIVVAGPGVARGYLDRPELTAGRFLPDPDVPDGRMYRTGDRGRQRADGVLEFLGRVDDQIKVRGARVEPAEVEAALLEHGAVRECAVVLARTSAAPRVPDRPVHCARCGLPATYPGAHFDADGICHLCRAFPAWQARVASYFRTLDDLQGRFAELRRSRPDDGRPDCVMLLSGGKDSTYALCRLVEMGIRVLAFTLDNGYLSEEAKHNIRRVTERLGVEHVFGSTPAMNAIFVDSLKRHANVCNGCFKTIYTMGVRLARERGVRAVVTGLSRGQFFETRLTEELFRDDAVDADRIDRIILDARRVYHRTDDAVARLLDTREFADDALFEEVEFIDFYRYCDVGLDAMMAYLAERVPWIRPADTGRSTNCRINEVGIWMHRRERGHHNYAFPYSWDVRVGHKTRAAAIHELTDVPDTARVRRILAEIGYDAPLPDDPAAERLVAFHVSDAPVSAGELRAHLARTLPAWMIPDRFVRLESMPLTPHGKVDRAALRDGGVGSAGPPAAAVPPRTPVESRLAAIWAGVLGLERVGALDEFLDLGGNSLVAIRILSRVNEAFAIELPPQSAFEASTVAALARLVEDVLHAQVEMLSDEEVERLAAELDLAPDVPREG